MNYSKTNIKSISSKILNPIGFLLFSFYSMAQSGGIESGNPNSPVTNTGTNWSVNPFEQKVFIENNGQFDGRDSLPSSQVKYGIEMDGMQFYFSPSGLTYRLNEIVPMSKEEQEEIEKDGFEKGPTEHETDRVPQKLLSHFVHMQWLGASPTTQLVAEDMVSNYYTYPNLKDVSGKSGIKANAYKKITYINLYPNIDVEYFFPNGREGIKYNIILHPGADVSLIQMQYSGDLRGITTDKDGNLQIATPFGNITDHAPITHDINGLNIPSDFYNINNVISFSLDKTYKSDQTKVIIDPWTTIPIFTESGAFDIDCDLQGNVYIFGGGVMKSYYCSNLNYPVPSVIDIPNKIMKLNSAGNIQWTHTASELYHDNEYVNYGDFAVDPHTGSVYFCEGHNPADGARVHKLNSSGINSGMFPGNPNMDEMWRMAYNECTNQIVIGGGGLSDPSNQLAVLDTSLTNFTPVPSFSNKPRIDVCLVALDDKNYCYAVNSVHGNSFTTNQLIKVPIPSLFPPVFTISNIGYRLSEFGIVYPAGGERTVYSTDVPPVISTGRTSASNGLNGIGLSTNFIYTYNSSVLKKWDINTGIFVSSAKVCKAYYGVEWRSSAADRVLWSGLAVDKCDNIFVGGQDSLLQISCIYQYNNNLEKVIFAITPDTIYDLKLGYNNELYACGNGFVASYQLTTPPCIAITLTSGVGTDAQNLCINTPVIPIIYSITGNVTGATATGLPAGVTGSFAGGVFTITGTPTVSGTFNYIVQTEICGQVSTTGTIVVNPLPVITSIPFTNESSCGAGDGTITINATGVGLTYSINGGNSFVAINTFTGLAASSYPIVVQNSFGCSVNGGTISVSSPGAPPAPIAIAIPNPLCSGSDLTLLVASSVVGETYTWTGPKQYSSTGDSVIIPNATNAINGLYTVTASIGACVSPGGSVAVIVNPNAAIALTSAAGTDAQTLCINSSITPITYSVTGGGTGATVSGLPAGLSGVFAAGVFTISGTPIVAGSPFSYTINTTGTCNQVLATGSITVNPDAAIALTSAVGTDAQTLCANNSITPVTYSVTGGGTGATVSGLTTGLSDSFSGGIVTISGTPVSTGTSSFIVNTTGTCAQTFTVGSITVNPNAAIALISAAGTDVQTLCINSPITDITYSITGGGTGAVVTGLPTGLIGSFSAGEFTITGLPATTGVANYTVNTIGTCAQTFASGSLMVNPIPPTPTAISNSPICEGIPLNLTAGLINGATYLWTGPNGFSSTQQNPVLSSATAATNGIYSVIATVLGCSSTAGSTTVIINPIPASPTLLSNSPVCEGAALNLTASTISGATYLWTGSNAFSSTTQNPSILAATASASGIYRVAATVLGCTVIDSVEVSVLFCDEITGELYPPTAFSPNADGVNDVYLPITKNIKTYKLFIFNRWGEKIFESSDTQLGWDGMFAGELVEQNVYVYMIQAIGNNDKPFNLSGVVTLVK